MLHLSTAVCLSVTVVLMYTQMSALEPDDGQGLPGWQAGGQPSNRARRWLSHTQPWGALTTGSFKGPFAEEGGPVPFGGHLSFVHPKSET